MRLPWPHPMNHPNSQPARISKRLRRILASDPHSAPLHACRNGYPHGPRSITPIATADRRSTRAVSRPCDGCRSGCPCYNRMIERRSPPGESDHIRARPIETVILLVTMTALVIISLPRLLAILRQGLRGKGQGSGSPPFGFGTVPVDDPPPPCDPDSKREKL